MGRWVKDREAKEGELVIGDVIITHPKTVVVVLIIMIGILTILL